jgi:hypothetical protein
VRPDPVSRGWRKLGRVLEAQGGPLSRTHVMLPTPHPLEDRVRVFFTSCDDDLRGRVFFADFEPEPPFAVLDVSSSPVLDPGAPGAFDCDGVNPSQIVTVEGRLALLYIGWRRGGETAPYTLFAGLALSENDGLSFEKAAEPLLPPCAGESLFRTAPFLQREGEGYRLLYIGGDEFVAGEGGRRLPVYSLMELRSATPWRWEGPGRTLLTPDRQAGEIGFGRPVLWRDDGRARLMMSIRTSAGYTLVDAPSDFTPGQRPKFTQVLDSPAEAWEADMTCFGAPCAIGDYELLFYNGDGFGRTGLGLGWRNRRA